MLNTFRALFDDAHQGNHSYDDFISCDVKMEVTKKYVDNTLVYVASEKLRAYQSFLNTTVIQNLKVNEDVVFSYRKGVNVADAVRKHATSKHFYQTDLRSFFASIDKNLIERILLEGLNNMPFIEPEKYVSRIIEMTTVDGILPVGFSTSPAISNASLFDFDERLLNYCNLNELKYTRYCDDIIVSGADKEAVRIVGDVIYKLLVEVYGHRFSVNEFKSKFTHIGRKIKLLGMVVLPNGVVTLDIRFKRKVQQLIHYYNTDPFKFLILVEDDLNKGRQRISGYLSYINTVDKVYLDKLRAKYGKTTIDMFLHLSTS